jgi:anti-sigma28 factor (negative regulator of flagellin synthesis)
MKVNYISTTSPKTIEVKNYSPVVEKSLSGNGEAEKTSSTSEDRISISERARDLQHTEIAVREELERIPELREERVMELRAKLKEGAYGSHQVLEASAEKVIEHFSKSALCDEIEGSRKDQVEKSRERKNMGYYDREER